MYCLLKPTKKLDDSSLRKLYKMMIVDRSFQFHAFFTLNIQFPKMRRGPDAAVRPLIYLTKLKYSFNEQNFNAVVKWRRAPPPDLSNWVIAHITNGPVGMYIQQPCVAFVLGERHSIQIGVLDCTLENSPYDSVDPRIWLLTHPKITFVFISSQLPNGGHKNRELICSPSSITLLTVW